MKECKLLTFLSMAFLCTISVQAKAWRGIEPLHSTRSDVERIIGSKVVRCGVSSCIYDLGDETVFVLYAKESNCNNNDTTTSWRVPAATVLEIGIHFKKDRALSELQFELSKFEQVEDKELPGWIYYLNVAEGVRIEGGFETASGITYFPAAKDKYLHCPTINKAKIFSPRTKTHHQIQTSTLITAAGTFHSWTGVPI